ncbi:hypothetical protein ASPZODRAFT_123234 [Penicilliopsis zonata CBS 506.65]|uniref:Clr5 domain-containing protein n=1 Tax=Penicilliopsis zonata CBS 506.65 TaxID=1073090 RepID=A0A1L9S8W5_9EURO|nr:hypothetical protein ASPZODRAFT_123234 [Penicilliopsis zonata CBS 506.65]OJJ43584.1 hypothetical protein ASPZODRAFT_123234 [Penicilliopsis zonata CBS 506.65]
MADADWESVKPEIERLYIQENMPLPQVMDRMESMYAFHRTRKQYERKLKSWKFLKYNTRPLEDWQFVGRKLEKRRREKKDSEVYFDGVQQPPQKVRKATYKKAFVSTIDRITSISSPVTPEGVVVCTPASPGMRLAWDASLPWLRFSSLLQPEHDPDQPSLLPSLTVASPRDADTSSYTLNHEVIRCLSSILPWKRLTTPPGIDSSTRTTAALTVLMPEEYEGQHCDLSASLCSSKHTNMDRLSLELYLLSNNLASHNPTGTSFEAMETDDTRVMKLFHESGWNSAKHLETILAISEPTAGAILEKVFASAIRLLDTDTVERMLKAGMDPNSPIETVRHGALIPLQFAATINGNTKLLSLFLSHGADVNCSKSPLPALYFALISENEEAVDILLSHCATVTPAFLAEAVSRSIHISLIGRLIEACPDINARNSEWEQTALARAVIFGRLEAVQLLLAKGAQVNILEKIYFGGYSGKESMVLGLAIRERGVDDIFRLLLEACTNVNPDPNGRPYISPLAIAVDRGNLQITKILIQKGADILVADSDSDTTLLELAAKHKNVELGRLLIDNGARVDRPLSAGKAPPSAIFLAVKNNATDLIPLLIEAGARLNDEYRQHPGTVLGAAIENGDALLIQYLRNAGATMLGKKLQKIRDVNVAIYLQQNGILQSIMAECGHRIFAAALSARDYNLAHFLLFNSEFNFDDHASDIPLEAAIESHNLFFVDALLDLGARVTDRALTSAVRLCAEAFTDTNLLRRLLSGFQGNAPTAVGAAIRKNRCDLLQLILEAGVDPTGAPWWSGSSWGDEVGFFGAPESVLELAAQLGDPTSILQVLLQSALWDPRASGRALAIAVILHKQEAMEELLAAGADVNQEVVAVDFPYKVADYENRDRTEILTPLQAAVSHQQVSMVERLAKYADVNYLGRGQRTALQLAVERGNMELVNMLLRHGADINGPPVVNRGATALQIAAIRGYLGLARRLIDLGAEVNAEPVRFDGRTALEGAAEYGRIDMLYMLVQEGALLVGNGERQYQRAVRLAERNGHMMAAKLLRSFRAARQSDTPKREE